MTEYWRLENVTTGAEYINALDSVFTSIGVDKLIDLYSDDYLNFHLVNSSLDELVKSGFVHPMRKNNFDKIIAYLKEKLISEFMKFVLIMDLKINMILKDFISSILPMIIRRLMMNLLH